MIWMHVIEFYGTNGAACFQIRQQQVIYAWCSAANNTNNIPYKVAGDVHGIFLGLFLFCF